MNYRYQYKTSEDRERLISLYSNLILIEEQNITEGNFLIFSERPIVVQPTIEEKILAENQYQTMLLELATLGGV